MTTSRELHHFLLLSHDEQLSAIRRLAALRWSPETIAAATRLSVEQIRAALTDAAPNDTAQTSAPHGSARCSRTGIPAKVCTCIGPHEVSA